MNNIFYELYDLFHIPLPLRDAEQEVNDCHRKLIERLEKPERKLVLRIINTQDEIADARSRDSFLCGFWLAWRMASELFCYDPRERLEPEDKPEEDTLARRPCRS